uniref:Uncharacterized protein n=1 Tax=Nelumbo nucifera TaxID=4432 RepID=A0A822XRE1_NELNU|nr:TPA_asm: hypothetical protein HUJ06_022798 [Nelumbo nucifera]
MSQMPCPRSSVFAYASLWWLHRQFLHSAVSNGMAKERKVSPRYPINLQGGVLLTSTPSTRLASDNAPTDKECGQSVVHINDDRCMSELHPKIIR